MNWSNSLYGFVRAWLPSLNKAIFIFLFRLLIVFIVYKALFFIIWRVPALTQLHENYVVAVIHTILFPVKWILEFFDFPVSFFPDERIIRIANSGGVKVSPPCSGLDIMFLYLSIIFSYPQTLKRKFSYALSGVFLIHILNILRITALALISYYTPQWVEINHKIIFNIVVYGCITFIWWKFINHSF